MKIKCLPGWWQAIFGTQNHHCRPLARSRGTAGANNVERDWESAAVLLAKNMVVMWLLVESMFYFTKEKHIVAASGFRRLYGWAAVVVGTGWNTIFLVNYLEKRSPANVAGLCLKIWIRKRGRGRSSLEINPSQAACCKSLSWTEGGY